MKYTVLYPPPLSQRGASLIVSLLFLIVLTLLGITTMSKSVMEEKVVHNQRDTALGMEAAESGLKDIETWLRAQSAKPLSTIMGGGMVRASGTFDGTAVGGQPATWWTANGVRYGTLRGLTPLPGVDSQPVIVTQEVAVPGALNRDNLLTATGYQPQPSVEYYQISAQGAGQNSATRVTLQSIYAQRFN